ncbi:MAG TPA: hypothetical protein VLE49_07045, partial [Anaerolineales bacterium]|nr:hypothetical protein [Anaerolineales bacterium]
NVGYSSHVLIQVADAQKIPTVIVPFTIANITEVAESYFDLPENRVSSDLINRLTGRLFPRWVYSYRGRKLLRLPAERILAMELSGLTSTQPWLFNSGAARTVAVESHRMLQHYLAEGLSADRLIVTGSLSDDVLFEAACNADAKRQKLFDDFGLSHGAPLLLCALPPSQFPRDCEFADYESLLSFWMESLSQVKQWNVIVRPHPRMPESAIDLIRGFGIPIALRDTASLVALCDLYLASVSATVRWAIARGIPVINYDVYHMGYRDYAGVEGVLTIDDREAFLRTLERVTHDRKYYEKIAAAQKEEMGNWGMLDGKSGARMLQLFDQVAVKKH